MPKPLAGQERKGLMTTEPNPMTSAQATKSIAVAELADELGTYKQTIFKIAKRLNLQAMKRREPTRGNELMALVSEADDEQVPTEQEAG